MAAPSTDTIDLYRPSPLSAHTTPTSIDIPQTDSLALDANNMVDTTQALVSWLVGWWLSPPMVSQSVEEQVAQHVSHHKAAQCAQGHVADAAHTPLAAHTHQWALGLLPLTGHPADVLVGVGHRRREVKRTLELETLCAGELWALLEAPVPQVRVQRLQQRRVGVAEGVLCQGRDERTRHGATSSMGGKQSPARISTGLGVLTPREQLHVAHGV
mmetsp:Transcript_15477/g.36824  ORF Transcript_15477/g.36824 Transcript_15477/m.36824 type:complete len:214 (+) Transcript_15477:1567-2208(+)